MATTAASSDKIRSQRKFAPFPFDCQGNNATLLYLLSKGTAKEVSEVARAGAAWGAGEECRVPGASQGCYSTSGNEAQGVPISYTSI